MSRRPSKELALCDRRRALLLFSLNDVRQKTLTRIKADEAGGTVLAGRAGTPDGLNLAVAYHCTGRRNWPEAVFMPLQNALVPIVIVALSMAEPFRTDGSGSGGSHP
jgi:hypothetical protein